MPLLVIDSELRGLCRAASLEELKRIDPKGLTWAAVLAAHSASSASGAKEACIRSALCAARRHRLPLIAEERFDLAGAVIAQSALGGRLPGPSSIISNS